MAFFWLVAIIGPKNEVGKKSKKSAKKSPKKAPKKAKAKKEGKESEALRSNENLPTKLRRLFAFASWRACYRHYHYYRTR